MFATHPHKSVDNGHRSRVDRGPSAPQPTTVSHDGGCANRSGARVSRCTPTGLSHDFGVLTRATLDARPVATARKPSA